VVFPWIYQIGQFSAKLASATARAFGAVQHLNTILPHRYNGALYLLIAVNLGLKAIPLYNPRNECKIGNPAAIGRVVWEILICGNTIFVVRKSALCGLIGEIQRGPFG
jgi:hypothetical protein